MDILYVHMSTKTKLNMLLFLAATFSQGVPGSRCSHRATDSLWFGSPTEFGWGRCRVWCLTWHDLNGCHVTSFSVVLQEGRISQNQKTLGFLRFLQELVNCHYCSRWTWGFPGNHFTCRIGILGAKIDALKWCWGVMEFQMASAKATQIGLIQ